MQIINRKFALVLLGGFFLASPLVASADWVSDTNANFAFQRLVSSEAMMRFYPQPPSPSDPLNWLVEHICVGTFGNILSVDPYPSCPPGSRERRLTVGDPLPYFRHDQSYSLSNRSLGFQRFSAYPIIDYGVNNSPSIAAVMDGDFNYATPYGTFEAEDGDGGDLYRVIDGWVSGGITRDGGGYSQTFLGSHCKPYGGWVFFPASFLNEITPGARSTVRSTVRSSVSTLQGRYWEQNGESWPGVCNPSHFVTTLTEWYFDPNATFGEKRRPSSILLPPKTIPSIVSTHGYPNGLERFYFTNMYGLTRWETWGRATSTDPFYEARGNKPRPEPDCLGTTTMTHRGLDYIRSGCRDWSFVQIKSPPVPPPPWPHPSANLLKNWHFVDTLAPWQSTGGAGLALRNSVTVADTRFSYIPTTGKGVAYLRFGCDGNTIDGAGNFTYCNRDKSIYQDIPINSLFGASQFDYGFSGVMNETGKSGSVRATIAVLDSAGNVLDEHSFDSTVRDPQSIRDRNKSGSKYFASRLFLKTSKIFDLRSPATTIRFSLTPLYSSETFNIVDTWLMPHHSSPPVIVAPSSFDSGIEVVPRPNLVIPEAITPSMATIGIPTTFSAAIRNIGFTTNAPFRVIFQRKDSSGAITDLPPAVETTGGLDFGESRTLTKSYVPGPLGEMRACADMSSKTDVGTISESTETDNCSPWRNVGGAASTNRMPIGYFDGATCSNLYGWTYDPDSSGTSIDVHIYEGSTFITGIKADKPRSDVHDRLGIGINHGFSIPTPASLKDGRPHTLKVHAIDTAGGANPQLTSSPRTITCTPPATTIPTNLPPLGYLDGNCSSFWGWAYDPTASSTSIIVRIEDEKGTVYSSVANAVHTGVNTGKGITGNHGIYLPFPASLKDGIAHTFRAYGVDTTTNTRVAFVQPLKTFTCGAPAPTGQTATAIEALRNIISKILHIFW